MKLPVLVEPIAGKGFVARAISPFDWSAEGATADEAVANLEAKVLVQIKSGKQAAEIEFPSSENRLWVKHRKLDLDNPVVREWLQIMQENRLAADNDPNVF